MARRTSQPDVSSPESAAATAATPRRTQRERSFQAEQALLDAASTLFARRGVDQTSLADVGELAGYSRGLANHHFGSKATLVEELAKRIQGQFVDGLTAHGEVEDAVEALVELVGTYLATIERHREVARAFFVMWGAAIPADAALRPVFAADDAEFRRAVEATLRAGQADGTVDGAVDPSAGAAALVGMLRGVVAQHLVDPDAVDLSAATQACRHFVRASFAPSRKAGRAKR